MQTLHDITLKYSVLEVTEGYEKLNTGSDKLVVHNYPVAYEELFEPIREQVKSVLEVGVAGGWSLKIWEEYFPNAMIHCVDIDPDTFQTHIGESPRIDMRFFDGTNEENLHNNFEDNMFDVIIDDGSHLIDHQVLTAAYLWPKLKPGGIFVIEDTQDLRYDKYFTMYPNFKVYDCASQEYIDKGDISHGPPGHENRVAWNSQLYTFRK